MKLKIPSNTDTLSIVLKVVGETCNLDCVYCYEKRKPYEGSRIMSPEILSNFLQSFSDVKLNIEIHGGEPLLLSHVQMKEIIDCIKNHKSIVNLHIQTNGTLLNQNWITFFQKEWPSISFGISLDGIEASNSYRYNYLGINSYEKVIKGVSILNDNHIDFGIISVVTSRSMDFYKESMDLFSTYGCMRSLKYVPCFDFNVNLESNTKRTTKTLNSYKNQDNLPDWSIKPLEYANFLINAWEYWKEKCYFNHFVINPQVTLLKVVNNNKVDDCTYSENKCGHIYTLYPDGSFGLCDEFRKNESLLNTVNDFVRRLSIIDNKSMHENLNLHLEKCGNCSYYLYCKGGCLATRKRLYGSSYYEEYCDYRKTLIDYFKKS